MKRYKIEKFHNGRQRIIEGTLQELVSYFRYTLSNGNAYNPKISKSPRTIKSLENNLNRAIREIQGACYNQDSYHLIRE